jgi:WD40 repeat protein
VDINGHSRERAARGIACAAIASGDHATIAGSTAIDDQPMGNEQNRGAALSNLFTEMFDGDGAGLLRWVRLHLGKTMHDELPASSPLSQLAFDITLAIERHGRARQAFARLFEERPGQAGRIQEVARLWGVAADVVPDDMPETIPAAASARLGRLWEVPELPPHYLARSADVEQLERALLEPDGGAVGITAMGQSSQRGVDTHGLYGMGGIGKSVLAAAIARQPAVRERFPGGIFWIAVGQTPQLAFLQAQLCRALGYTEVFDSSEGTRRLRELVGDRPTLLVLDDVWDAAHAQALDVVGSAGRILVTTRDLEVLTWLDAREHCLDVLGPAQALSLLADWTQGVSDALPPAAADVARACGYLPLALAMIGALVRRGRSWAEMQTWLDEAQLVRIQGNVPAYPYRNVLQAVDASVTALAAVHGRARQCYIDLAVFPEDTPIPRSVVRRLWSRHGLRTADADALADTLSDRALARRDEADRVMLHDLQRLYARSQVEDLAALHGALADTYLARSGQPADARDGRYAGLDDGYFFQHLPWHLAEAGRQEALAALLFDFDWLDAKLHATSLTDLVADFALLSASHPASGEAALVHDALRLSSHALARDSRQLPGQLVGRLGGLEQGNTRITALLTQTRGMTRYTWLRPVTPSLTPPGGALLRTLAGHDDRVLALAVTHDSRRAVSGSRDGTLKLWDLELGTELRTLPGHRTSSGQVLAVAVTPDGRRAVSGSDDSTLKLWDLELGTELRTLPGHAQAGIGAVAVTPDGRRAISGAMDGTVKLWDLELGTELCSLAGHDDWVRAVAVTPDGRRAVSASCDSTLKLWDLERGTELRTLVGHTSWVMSVFVTLDGRRAISTSSDSCRLWDLELGTELRPEGPGSHALVAMMPDGRRAVLASLSGLLALGDLEQGIRLRFLGNHGAWVDTVAVTPDGRGAVSGARDGTLKLWSLEQGTDAGHVRIGARAAMAVTPDGRHALSASHPVGRNNLTASHAQTLMLWDRERGTELRTLAGHKGSVRAVVAYDNQHAVSASDDGTLKLWDLERGTELHTLTGHQGPVQSVAVTPDDRRAVSGAWDGTLKLWDLEQGTELRTLAGHNGRVNAVAVTSNGRCAVSASDDGTLKLWDLEQGTELRTLAGHERSVQAVAVTPDGRRALSTSYDNTLKLWDLERGTELRTLAGTTIVDLIVAVTPDGRRALSSHPDGILVLWDMEEGKEVRILTGHVGTVRALAVTPDGQHAVSASEDRTLKLWDLDTGQVLATFTADGVVRGGACSSMAPVFVAADTLGHIHILEFVKSDDGA